MRRQNAELKIVPGLEKANGYVWMRHGNQYSIQLANHSTLDADVTLYVDDEVVGEFRIKANARHTIERPVDRTERFTFYKKGSSGFRRSGKYSGDRTNGVVRAVWRFGHDTESRPVHVDIAPYRRRSDAWTWNNSRTLSSKGIGGQSISASNMAPGYDNVMDDSSVLYERDSAPRSLTFSAHHATGQSVGEGATGYSGYSGQQFYTVKELDYTGQEVDLSLRLVCHPQDVRKPERVVVAAPPPVR